MRRRPSVPTSAQVRAVEGSPAFRPHGEGHAARSHLPGASYPQPSAAGRVRALRGRRFSALAAWPVFPFTSEPPTAFRLPPAWLVRGRLPGSVPRGRSRPGDSARDSTSSRDVAASWTSREARRPWRPRPGAERGRFPELFAPLMDSGLRGAGGGPPSARPRGSNAGHTRDATSRNVLSSRRTLVLRTRLLPAPSRGAPRSRSEPQAAHGSGALSAGRGLGAKWEPPK